MAWKVPACPSQQPHPILQAEVPGLDLSPPLVLSLLRILHSVEGFEPFRPTHSDPRANKDITFTGEGHLWEWGLSH